MIKKQRLEIENLLIDQLKGKLALLMPQSEREVLVDNALKIVIQKDTARKFSGELETDEERKTFIRQFLSYDPVERLLCDNMVEDIVINQLKPIFIHHNERGFIPTELRFETQQEVDTFIRKIFLFAGRDNEEYKRIANLALADLGGRVNIVKSPFGSQLTITKAKVDPISIINLIDRGSMSFEAAAQLWVYMDGLQIRPANIIIAGGPGVGKTTLLNALMPFIPETHHTVVIEDTLELNTNLSESYARLESDEELSLADLVKNTLRMRPERIIVGEVRGEEARDMVTAVNVGKYCMGTIHALTAREAIVRLQNEPMNIPKDLVSLFDVFVVLKRYHVDNQLFRVVDEMSETGAIEGEKVLLSQIFKYNYSENKVDRVSPSTTYRDRLAEEAGIPARDIIKETLVRAFVLKTLSDKNISTTAEIVTFCRAYQSNPKDAMSRIGLNRKSLLKEAENMI